jgi:hypothetical protein
MKKGLEGVSRSVLVYKYTLFYFVLDCVKQILTFNQYMSDALFTHNTNNFHDSVIGSAISQVVRHWFLVAKATLQYLTSCEIHIERSGTETGCSKSSFTSSFPITFHHCSTVLYHLHVRRSLSRHHIFTLSVSEFGFSSDPALSKSEDRSPV